MRVAAVTFVAILAAGVSGCDWLKSLMRPNQVKPPATGAVEPRSAEQLVEYLNRQAGYLQSVKYPDVSIGIVTPADSNTLGDSTLVCAKPRNLLLVGGKRLIDLVQVGSNDAEFWVYAKFTDQPYQYCNYQDFPQVAQKLPFPFDPDWVLQALGMSSYDPTLAYAVETNALQREHRLKFSTTAPNGSRLQRVVVFAADPADAPAPQVKRHLILDDSGRLVAAADVTAASLHPVGTDPTTGKPAAVLVPTKVRLEWPPQGVKMDFALGRPQVNTVTDADKVKLFTRPPTIGNQRPVNMATAGFGPTGFRGAMPRR